MEELFAQVAGELRRREILLMERISGLEGKIAELEEKLARMEAYPFAAEEEVMAEKESVVAEEEQPPVVVGEWELFKTEPVPVDEEIEIEFEFEDPVEGSVEDMEVEEAVAEEIIEEELPDDEEAGGIEVMEVDEEVDMEERISVMDKAKPDWFDWEVDIPGPYIEDIWDGIGLNDRMLFLNDLFGGNEDDFNEAVSCLNEVESLVGAVEYIRDKYPYWNEESDEVYRFYMTVRRRFNKQK